MIKYTAQCAGCKAKFEVTIDHQKKIVCPSCDCKKINIIKEEEVELSGCDDCHGCSGCH